MRESSESYCANDKEIFDLLISSKQKITERVLRELTADRGIFLSPRDSREDIVKYLAGLLHDYYDVNGIIERQELSKRAEKTTSIILDHEFDIKDIRDAAVKYHEQTAKTESVIPKHNGINSLAIKVEYDEFDYSRTRLNQRQRRESSIEFTVEEGKTRVRLPATDKSKLIVESIKNIIEEKNKKEVKIEEISLFHITDHGKRTLFFTSMIKNMHGYHSPAVTNLKVLPKTEENSEAYIDDDDDNAEITEKMISIVKNVILSDENLVATKEYQNLRKNGFFITSITWNAIQKEPPFHKIQFDLDFDNAREGTGFKYGVRIAPQLHNGGYPDHFRAVKEIDRGPLFELIESTARSVLNDL